VAVKQAGGRFNFQVWKYREKVFLKEDEYDESFVNPLPKIVQLGQELPAGGTFVKGCYVLSRDVL
jgi:hypothetical protein